MLSHPLQMFQTFNRRGGLSLLIVPSKNSFVFALLRMISPSLSILISLSECHSPSSAIQSTLRYSISSKPSSLISMGLKGLLCSGAHPGLFVELKNLLYHPAAEELIHENVIASICASQNSQIFSYTLIIRSFRYVILWMQVYKGDTFNQHGLIPPCEGTLLQIDNHNH